MTVNFTNILRATLYADFMCLQFGFLIFWKKDFGAKAAHKMLVKLTPGYLAEALITTVKSFVAQIPKSFFGSFNFFCLPQFLFTVGYENSLANRSEGLYCKFFTVVINLVS
jgi:hypothetical protein